MFLYQGACNGFTLMTSCAMDGVILTQRVKQSLASDTFPSRSSCLPFCRFACRRLEVTTHEIIPSAIYYCNVYLIQMFKKKKILFLLSSGFLHLFFRRQVTPIKHQDGLNAKRKKHFHKLHTVGHIPVWDTHRNTKLRTAACNTV